MGGATYNKNSDEDRPKRFRKLFAPKTQADTNKEPNIKKNADMESGFVKTRPNNKEASQNQQDPQIPTTKSIQPRKSKNVPTSIIQEKPEEHQGKIVIALSATECITTFIALLIIMSFIFLFGIIIGKGTLPTYEKAEQEQILSQNHIINTIEVLPQEELKFMTNLKQEIPTEGDDTNQEKGSSPQISPTEGSTKAKILEQTSAAHVANTNTEKTAKVLSGSNTQLYDFNIRAAAFRAEDQADTLRAQLEGQGYRTRLITENSSNGKWFFVHVLIRGTEQRLLEAKKEFEKFAIKDSIVKEKTLVK